MKSSKINDILVIVKQNQEDIKVLMANQDTAKDDISSLKENTEENATRLELVTLNMEELQVQLELNELIARTINRFFDYLRNTKRQSNESDFAKLNNENKSYGEYCNSFQFIVLNYLHAYRSASTDLFVQNIESVQTDNEKIGLRAAKFAVSAFGSVPYLGLVSNVGNLLLSLYYNYSMNEYIDRVNITNRLLRNDDLEYFLTTEDIELMAQYVAIKATYARKKKIIDFIENGDQKESIWLKRGIKWLNDKFVAPGREYIEGSREKRFDKKVDELAERDVLTLFAQLFKKAKTLDKYPTLEQKLIYILNYISDPYEDITKDTVMASILEEKDSEIAIKDSEIAKLLDNVEKGSFFKCFRYLSWPFKCCGGFLGIGKDSGKKGHVDVLKTNIKATEDILRDSVAKDVKNLDNTLLHDGYAITFPAINNLNTLNIGQLNIGQLNIGQLNTDYPQADDDNHHIIDVIG